MTDQYEEAVNEGIVEGEEGSSTPEGSETEPKTVPLDRFNAVYGKSKALEERVKELEAKEASGKTLTDGQAKELEAKKYLKDLIDETLKEKEETNIKMTRAEKAKFDEEVEDSLLIHTDVKKADFIKFYNGEAKEFGVSNVESAVKLYKHLGKVQEDSTQKAKDNIAKKPSFPSNEGAASAAPADDKDKSLHQIVEESIRGARK